MPSPERPLLADVREEINALKEELREMASARWELARLELAADLRAVKRLAVVWTATVVMSLSALPLAAVWAAETLSGCWGISRGHWLLMFAAGLLLAAVLGGYCAWRRFCRKFVGLRETIEELREDFVWLREGKRSR
jgi:hypothetical protein